MKKVFLILALLYVCFIQLFSQPPKAPFSVLSPNAASLGIYGNIPVSHFTGTPDITISLHEVIVGNYTLPVSLNYHPSGIRPDQHPGWVGLGWSLQAGGLITREVKDAPDEYDNPKYELGKQVGYYYNYDVLNTPSWNHRDYLRSIAQNEETSLKDKAPDEFSFNIPGYTGKFYLNHNGEWVVQCSKPVKVLFDNTFLDIPFSKARTSATIYDYSPSFSGFTIITEDGTQYIFGGSTASIDYSIDFFGQSIDEWIATAWYLSKIVFLNKQEINFKYERGNFINQMYIALNYMISLTTSNDRWSPKCASIGILPVEAGYQGKLIAPTYLKQISTDNTIIIFNRSLSNELKYENTIYRWANDQWRKSNSSYSFLSILGSDNIGYPSCLDNLKWHKLDTIKVINKDNSIIKTINFSYTDSSNQRLTLLAVKESGKNPYTLEYYKTQDIPRYLSHQTDHWGFYNNTYANHTMADYYLKRNPQEPYTKYGVLSKVTYPTGGYTVFEFEAHDYRSQVKLNRWEGLDYFSTNQLAGGLRIKSIENYTTNTSKALKKNFFYVSDYLQNNINANISSGVLGGRIQYTFPNYVVYAFNDNDVKYRMSLFSSISVLLSCRNANGSHIGYSEVIEKRDDNAFTRYIYTNFDNGYLDEPADAVIQETRIPYEPYASKEQDRGLLKLQQEYNASGNKVKSKSIIYEKGTITSTNYIRSMNARSTSVCLGSVVKYDEGASYKIYTYLWRPISEIDTINGQNPITTITNYTYNADNFLQSETTIASDNSRLITKYNYTKDILGRGGVEKPVYQWLIDNHVIGTPIEQLTYKNNQLIAASFVNYKTFSDIPADWKIYPYEVLQLETGKPLTDYNTTGIDTRLKPQLYYDRYDEKGNALQVRKADGITVSYLWGYNKLYPIAEIVGATYDETVSKLGENDLQIISGNAVGDEELRTKMQLLRAKLPKAMVTSYTHRPLVGMTSQTDPNGITTYYEYDEFSRLKIERDHEGNVLKQYEYHYHQNE
jgi:YD repeat-containing protein